MKLREMETLKGAGWNLKMSHQSLDETNCSAVLQTVRSLQSKKLKMNFLLN